MSRAKSLRGGHAQRLHAWHELASEWHCPGQARQLALTMAGFCLLAAGLGISARGLDVGIFMRVQRLTEWLPPVFWSVGSVLGLGVSCALLAALAADERMRPVAIVLWSLVIGGLAVQVFKHLWPAPRPAAVLAADLIHVIGPRLRVGSMPSGHAATVAALACALAAEVRARSGAAALVCLLLGVLGCVARIAVGAHWPSDVLVGAGTRHAQSGRRARRRGPLAPGRMVRDAARTLGRRALPTRGRARAADDQHRLSVGVAGAVAARRRQHPRRRLALVRPRCGRLRRGTGWA